VSRLHHHGRTARPGHPEGKDLIKNAKFLVALLTAALSGVVNVLPVDSAATQYVNFALAVLGAVAVYLVPNAKARQGTGEVPHERIP
jgi:hypothetical protein